MGKDKDVEIVDTSLTASRYGAALLCLRLLRALLANTAFAIALFALLGVVLLIVMLGAGAGWLVLDQPWLTTVRWSAVGILIVGSLIVVLAVMVVIFIHAYTRAVRGSAVVSWLLLSLGALFLVGSIADLAIHASRAFSVSASARGTEVFESARDLWPIYVAVGFLYGAWGLIQIAGGGDLGVLFDHAHGENRRVSFYRMMGIPIVPGDHRPQLRRALGFAWLAFACEGFAFGTYFTSGSADQVPSMTLALAGAIVLFVWPLSVALLYGLLALSQWLWSLARRTGQPSLQDALAMDRRPPVLFLRSFTDDQVSLASARVPRYLRVMDPGITRHRFEELLIFGFGNVGPVIAIGNPSDGRPPIGASRQYFGAGDWQGQVLQHMSRARAIVVSLSYTEGLAWELDQIRERGYLPKVLFIVPPELSRNVHDVRMRAARAGLLLNAANLSGEDGVGDDLHNHVLACWSIGPDSETIVCSSHPSELDYEIALRFFVAASGVSNTRR